LDDCVRLHEITEGWPIGLQLAASSIEREDDLHEAVESLSARTGDIERYFIESLFESFAKPIGEFLTRIAILDEISPELCEAVTGNASSAAFLDQLASDTPILIVGELHGWIRLHPLARDFLLGRFEKLPASEQAALHRRAADWFAERERFPEAGKHALAAGEEARAQGYAERSLWTLLTQGRLAEARAWLDRLPEDAIAKDVHLSLIAAWIMALSDQPQHALPVAEKVLRDPSTDEPMQFEAALVATCAAAYADRLGVIPKVLARWPEPPIRLNLPIHLIAYANTLAVVALHAGETEKVRQLEAGVPATSTEASFQMAFALGRLLVTMSHLWDGNAYKAEAALLPALNQAERESGRRSIVATLYAAPLAAALLFLALSIDGLPLILVYLPMAYLVASVCIRPDHSLRAVLANKPVRYIGMISYGMYLLHMFANNAARRLAPGLGGYGTFVVTLIAAIAFASVSYQLYERRFLKLKERFGGRVRLPQGLSTVIRPGQVAAG